MRHRSPSLSSTQMKPPMLAIECNDGVAPEQQPGPVTAATVYSAKTPVPGDMVAPLVGLMTELLIAATPTYCVVSRPLCSMNQILLSGPMTIALIPPGESPSNSAVAAEPLLDATLTAEGVPYPVVLLYATLYSGVLP